MLYFIVALDVTFGALENITTAWFLVVCIVAFSVSVQKSPGQSSSKFSKHSNMCFSSSERQLTKRKTYFSFLGTLENGELWFFKTFC